MTLKLFSISVVGVFLFTSIGQAQDFLSEQDHVESNPLNSTLTEGEQAGSSKPKLLLSSYLEVPTHSFLISTDAGRVNQQEVDQRVQYNPTFGPNVGVKGTYGSFSLQYGQRLSFIDGTEKQIYGRTRYQDWRFGSAISNNIGLEIYYQNYNGFYADLSGQEGLQSSFGPGDQTQLASATPGSGAMPSDTSKNIINRPDVRALNYGARATYAISVSPILEVLDPQQRELESKWNFKFLGKTYFNHLTIRGDQTLVPEVNADAFSPIADLTQINTNTLGVGVGMGVQAPISKRTTVGFDAILGLGLQLQASHFVDHKDVGLAAGQEMNANFYFDWRSQQHAVRSAFYWDTLSSKVEAINFDSSNLGINFVYTYEGLNLGS